MDFDDLMLWAETTPKSERDIDDIMIVVAKIVLSSQLSKSIVEEAELIVKGEY